MLRTITNLIFTPLRTRTALIVKFIIVIAIFSQIIKINQFLLPAFKDFDQNGDGIITVDELPDVLEGIGLKPSQEEIEVFSLNVLFHQSLKFL